ncbi:MAG: DUF1289 domain-containing protein [Rhizobiales bacterium]|nr:DUF1289 domain-containing protein [Hyphomicrobiales bacterium]
MPLISTPCTGVCTIDAARGICRGCGRTADEIGQWLSLSEAERRAIMAALPARLRRADARQATA